ncbi:arginine methyltransferase [Gracilaria domingensis]|nr:arginine methyltransferase [Gracilaria domingensis]
MSPATELDAPEATKMESSPAQPLKSAFASKRDQETPEQLLNRLLPEDVVPGVIADADFDMTSSDYYFNSYAHFSIHEEMLKDEVRTRSYMRAIKDNPHLFEGKVVMDVGCGTGVLSIFAAQAGAKKVYAVECSKIVDQARMIISDNHFSDVIEVVESKVEDMNLDEKVDIIISEWMGYFLFYESMLDTVLYARDKWLKPGGLMFPDKATLYLCAIEDAQYKAEKIDFWDNVYGLNMSCIKNVALTEPIVDTVDPEQVMTNVCAVFPIDTTTVNKEQLSFAVPFSLTGIRNDYAHALVAYFDIEFSHCLKPVSFVTGPHVKPTHWKQTVLYLDRALPFKQGEVLEGVLACRPNNKNPRDLDIAIEYSFQGDLTSAKNLLRYRLR